MITSYRRMLCLLILAPLLLLKPVGKSIAQSSTNYQIKRFVLASGGTTSSSTSYLEKNVAGQPYREGSSDNTNYFLSSGFFGKIGLPGISKKLLVPENYPTITAALIDAIVKDTISVAAGTYPESFTMKNYVVLLSRSGPMQTIIARKGVPHLITGAMGAIIDGFTIADNDNGEGQPGNGILSDHDSLIIRHCIIRNNRTGIYLNNTSLSVLYNNTIDRNYVGIYMQVNPSPEIYNNIISNNVEYGIYRNTAHSLGKPYIQYNDYYGNPTDYGYYGSAWIPQPGIGELFKDPSYVGGIPVDYRLRSNSPCIDKGDPASPLDSDGTRADMGAIFFDKSSAIDFGIENTTPEDFILYPAYPNPFNPETSIAFDVKKSCHVILKIYNLLGHEVAHLVDAYYPQGHHQIKFQAAGLASGVYIYQIQMGDFRAMKKMVLLE